MWKGFHGKISSPRRQEYLVVEILWAKDQGFDLRLNDMASDDLLSESSEAPREGIEQEFQATCVVNSGEGVLKKADTFQIHTGILKSLQSESIAGQGICVGGGHSSSRPLPPPPHHYNKLLHIIRRHIIMSCIVLMVMMVDIILSVSPSNWGKVSNSTMRGCKAKGGQGQRPPRGHCFLFSGGRWVNRWRMYWWIYI